MTTNLHKGLDLFLFCISTLTIGSPRLSFIIEIHLQNDAVRQLTDCKDQLLNRCREESLKHLLLLPMIILLSHMVTGICSLVLPGLLTHVFVSSRNMLPTVPCSPASLSDRRSSAAEAGRSLLKLPVRSRQAVLWRTPRFRGRKQ